MDVKTTILQKAEGHFMKYGIRSVTMDDLARDMGISKKTLYQFFDNKDDLVRQVVECHEREDWKIVDQIRQEAKDPIHELLMIVHHSGEILKKVSPNIIYDLRKYHAEVWQDVQCKGRDRDFERILDNIRRGMQMGLYRSKINPEIVARLHLGTFNSILDPDVFPEGKFNLELLVHETMLLFIRGIASPKGIALLEIYLQ